MYGALAYTQAVNKSQTWSQVNFMTMAQPSVDRDRHKLSEKVRKQGAKERKEECRRYQRERGKGGGSRQRKGEDGNGGWLENRKVGEGRREDGVEGRRKEKLSSGSPVAARSEPPCREASSAACC